MKFPKNTFSKNLPITETNPAPSSATLFIKIASTAAINRNGTKMTLPLFFKNPLERLSGMTWQAEIPK